MPRCRRTCPTFEHIDHRTITCKEITLCRAGTGRVIPTSNRRPTGFAGNPRGYAPRGLPAKPVGRLLDVGITRPVPARHSVISLQVIVRWSMCSKVGQVLLHLGMLHEGHKRTDPFVRELGARNP